MGLDVRQQADIDNRFAFHPATAEEKRAAHASVRVACHELAVKLAESVPPSRELSTALTKLEEVMFWGNAALARMDADGVRLETPARPVAR